MHQISMHQTWRLVLIVLAALLAPWARGADDEPAAKRDDNPPAAAGNLELDDPVEPLVSTRNRSGRDEDRIRALALFAAGRVAEQKQDYPRALRNYQRAYRLDPEAVPVLREIVPLAFNLDRQAEAVRYALIMAEREPADPILLARLASYLTEEGDTARALKLCEKALAAYEQTKAKPSAPQVALWMELGRLYFVAKKYDQTAHYFGEVYKALENPQEFGLDATVQKGLLNKAELAYQLFGESFLEAGKTGEALAAFEKSNQIKSDEPLSLYNRARVDAKQKQPAQALAKLETYFEKHFATQGTGPYHLLADVLADLGQEDQLLARLEKIQAADPDNVPLAFFLAQRYRQAGQLDKAEPTFIALIERHKARPPLEAYQGLVDIYRQQKEPTKLLATLGEAVGRANSLSPLGEAGKALLADKELTAALVAEARRQLEAPGARPSYGSLLAAGLVAIEQKDFAAANMLFDRALKADNAKGSESLVTWGLELFLANQYADAAKVFQRGLEEKLLPEVNPTLHFYLAGALEMAGDTDEALAEARRAAELQKDMPRFHSRVAWIQYHAKRLEPARHGYQALVDRFDRNHESPEVREILRDARLVLSNICVMEEKMPESEEWLEQVLDEFPEDTGALNDLGYLWADANKHLELAQHMIQTAVAREPKNMAYRDSMGWVLFRLGKYPEAVAELKAAAASTDEPDATILDHLAEALLKSGDAAGAVENWDRAAASFDKNAEPDKARQIREKIAKLQHPAVEK
jgi:tetratricopeptide (TPR) repeat protein